MPRRCTVCDNLDRVDIEALLLEGVPFRHIATRFHVSTGLFNATRATTYRPGSWSPEPSKKSPTPTISSSSYALQGRTLAILAADTETSKDHPTALRAIGEARRNLELLAKLTELLGPETAVTVNIAIDQRAQQVILSALEPFPEARIAVAEALIEVEGYEE